MITHEERMDAIENSITIMANRFVERQILDASNETEAIKRAKESLRHFGRWGPDKPSIEGHEKGIRVRMPDGREGIISWRKLVQEVRKPKLATSF